VVGCKGGPPIFAGFLGLLLPIGSLAVTWP
jgi:hypothetical protein